MVNAGRVLIIPRGAWSNLETYEMLDIVSLDGVSYIGRKQSVGVNPSTDTQMQYWQPFGTAAEIATTEKAGLVMPDGTTITIDENGLIKVVLEITGLDDVNITSIANGQILVYNSTTHKWENKNLSAGNISYNNQTSGLESNKVQGAIDELVSKNQTLTTEVETKADQSLLAPIQATLVASKAYVSGEQFVYNGLLYKVTSSIAQGGNITIDGNCELSDDVCSQIKSLKSSLHPNYNVISQQLVVSDSTATQTAPKTHTLTVNAPGLAVYTLRSAANRQNNLYINDNTFQTSHRIGIGINGSFDAGNIPVNTGDVLYLRVENNSQCDIYIYS